MRYFALILTLFISALAVSQTVKYSGVIKNENSSKVNNYLITLKKNQGASIYSEITDNNHHFKFKNMPIGKYERCVQWFEKMQCDTLSLEKDVTDDTINIVKENTLDEVVIKTKKPMFQNKLGALIVNVEENPIMNSGTVFEAITKLPGVSYSHSNNDFQLKGKSGILIQIDGNSLLLSQNEIIEYLKTISADSIKNIEINANPSSKHDASGIAGIINIISKKNKKEGYFSSFSLNATQSKYYSQNSNLKFQYNKNKSQYSFQYANSFGANFEKAISEHQFSNLLSQQNTYAKINGNTNTLNFNYLQEFGKSNLLLSAFGSFYSEKIEQATILNFTAHQNNNVTSAIFSNKNSNNKLKNLNLSLKYNNTFESSKLTFSSYFLKYDIDNFSNLISVSNNNNNTVLDNNSPKTADLFVSQIDYAVTIDSLSSIDMGAKGIFQKLQNINNFFDVSSGISVFDTEKSNDFEYSESTWAGYAEYKRKIKKFDFILGSRIEYNPSKYNVPQKSDHGLSLKKSINFNS